MSDGDNATYILVDCMRKGIVSLTYLDILVWCGMKVKYTGEAVLYFLVRFRAGAHFLKVGKYVGT